MFKLIILLLIFLTLSKQYSLSQAFKDSIQNRFYRLRQSPDNIYLYRELQFRNLFEVDEHNLDFVFYFKEVENTSDQYYIYNANTQKQCNTDFSCQGNSDVSWTVTPIQAENTIMIQLKMNSLYFHGDNNGTIYYWTVQQEKYWQLEFYNSLDGDKNQVQCKEKEYLVDNLLCQKCSIQNCKSCTTNGDCIFCNKGYIFSGQNSCIRKSLVSNKEFKYFKFSSKITSYYWVVDENSLKLQASTSPNFDQIFTIEESEGGFIRIKHQKTQLFCRQLNSEFLCDRKYHSNTYADQWKLNCQQMPFDYCTFLNREFQENNVMKPYFSSSNYDNNIDAPLFKFEVVQNDDVLI